MSERPTDVLTLARALRERVEESRGFSRDIGDARGWVWDYLAERLDGATCFLGLYPVRHGDAGDVIEHRTVIMREVCAIARHYAPELLEGDRD